MSYGTLDPQQKKALRPFIKGKVLHDLGAGDLELAKVLLTLGAEHIHAYDKLPKPKNLPEKVTYQRGYFHELRGPFPVIFLSWPVNYPSVELTIQASLCEEMLIYLGKNTDGAACGQPNLFRVMTQRELLAYVPTRANTLIVTGRFLPEGQTRPPTPEEAAGLGAYTSGILAYENIECSP